MYLGSRRVTSRAPLAPAATAFSSPCGSRHWQSWACVGFHWPSGSGLVVVWPGVHVFWGWNKQWGLKTHLKMKKGSVSYAFSLVLIWVSMTWQLVQSWMRGVMEGCHWREKTRSDVAVIATSPVSVRVLLVKKGSLRYPFLLADAGTWFVGADLGADDMAARSKLDEGCLWWWGCDGRVPSKRKNKQRCCSCCHIARICESLVVFK